jgi:glutathione S-transferase
MLKLYDDPDSGNGYKVLLTLALLDVPYELVEVNAIQGETRKDAFLAKNPNGRIPLLELEDGTLLPESNAIMFYLAEGTPYLPDDRLGRARALQWMFFEQYSHEPYIAVLRFWTRHTDKTPENEPQWAAKEEGGYAALTARCGAFDRGRLALRLYPCGRPGRLRPLRLSRGARLDRALSGAGGLCALRRPPESER